MSTFPDPYAWPAEAYGRLLAAIREPLPEPVPLPDWLHLYTIAGLHFAVCVRGGDCGGWVYVGCDYDVAEELAWAHVDEWHGEAS